MGKLPVRYRLKVSTEDDAYDLAERIALEQSAELPKTVVEKLRPPPPTGEIVSISKKEEGGYELEINWPLSLIDGDKLQLVNVIFGNISLIPGIQLQHVDWSKIDDVLPGPLQGITGFRERLQVPERALSCTALKPVSLTSDELAGYLSRFASAGVDIIKDDHGLTNQNSAPFYERLKECSEAAADAEQKRGRACWYVPNVTATATDLPKRLEACREAGLNAVMITPHLTGLDALSQPAEFGLGALAHPAFSGSMVVHSDSGLHPALLYGELWRGFGADGVIYANSDGRFSYSSEDCEAINFSARNRDLPWKPAWPVPAGGINRDTVPYWLQRYGRDTIFLIGGSLYEAPEGLEQATRNFCKSLQNIDHYG